MSPETTFALGLWGLRLLFLLFIYLLLFQSIGALQKALARAPVPAEKALAFLVVADAPGSSLRRGQRYPLQAAVSAVGRDPGNDVVIHDEFCSSRHALLSYDGAEWWVEDAGSTNGTFVNGARADRKLPLHYGDEVELGRIRLRLEHA